MYVSLLYYKMSVGSFPFKVTAGVCLDLNMYGAEQTTQYSVQQDRYKCPFHLYPFYAHTYIFPLMQYISGEGGGISARLAVPQIGLMYILATSER